MDQQSEQGVRPADLTLPRRPLFPRRPLPERFCNFERLLKMMETRGLDGIVSSFAPNVFYLSGFAGNPAVDDLQGVGVVVLSRHQPDHPIMLVADVFTPWFLTQPSWIQDIRPFATDGRYDPRTAGSPLDPYIPVRSRQVDWVLKARQRFAADQTIAVRTAMNDLGLQKGRVGFDNPRLAARWADDTVDVFEMYSAMKYVRQVKTPAEIELLRTCTAINQLAIEKTVASWEPGLTWHEVNHTYHTVAVSLGGFVRDPLALIVMSDEVADPRLAIQIQTGFEKDYVIKNRTAIMFDCHGVWSHYCWDGGKTWVVGDDPTPRMSLVATAAGNAILEIIGQMRPGIRVSELQAVGRRALAKSGLARPEDALVYFHGLGLEHHDLELPQSKEFEDQNRFDWTLEEGMVVAVHIAIGGDTEDRYYTEDIALVTRHAGEGFFKWGPGPLLNSA